MKTHNLNHLAIREKDFSGCNADIAHALQTGHDILCKTVFGKKWITGYDAKYAIYTAEDCTSHLWVKPILGYTKWKNV